MMKIVAVVTTAATMVSVTIAVKRLRRFRKRPRQKLQGTEAIR
jgi:hypothetical protein